MPAVLPSLSWTVSSRSRALLYWLIAVEISTLKKRIKKLKSERADLKTTFREMQQGKQEKLLTLAMELDSENKELRAKIEAMELDSTDNDETE